jgi:hypothetical protein
MTAPCRWVVSHRTEATEAPEAPEGALPMAEARGPRAERNGHPEESIYGGSD